MKLRDRLFFFLISFDLVYAIKQEKAILSIEIGTTFTRYGVLVVNEYKFLGQIPSCLYLSKKNDIIFCANDDKYSEGNKLYSIKSFFKSNDSANNIKNPLKMYNHEINGKKFSIIELLTLFVEFIKTSAENKINMQIDDAIISVPTYFYSSERDIIINSVEKANLNLIRLIEEPISAAITCSMNRLNDNKNFFIIDLGQSRFTVSIVKVADLKFSILATNSNEKLSGSYLNTNLARYYFDYKKNINVNENAMKILSEKLENILVHKSTKKQVLIEIDNFYEEKKESKFSKTIYLKEIKYLIKDDFDRLTKLMFKTLEETGIKPDVKDEIILMGKYSNLPDLDVHLKSKFYNLRIRKENPVDDLMVHGNVFTLINRNISITKRSPNEFKLFTLSDYRNYKIFNLYKKNEIAEKKKTVILDQGTNKIEIFEGEGHYVKDLKSICKKNIPAVHNPLTKFEFVYDIDINGQFVCDFKNNFIIKDNSKIKVKTGDKKLNDLFLNLIINYGYFLSELSFPIKTAIYVLKTILLICVIKIAYAQAPRLREWLKRDNSGSQRPRLDRGRLERDNSGSQRPRLDRGRLESDWQEMHWLHNISFPEREEQERVRRERVIQEMERVIQELQELQEMGRQLTIIIIPQELPNQDENLIPTQIVNQALNEQNEICSICQEPLVLNENYKQLNCSHLFHSDCIDQWLRESSQCPNCRSQVLARDYLVESQIDEPEENDLERVSSSRDWPERVTQDVRQERDWQEEDQTFIPQELPNQDENLIPTQIVNQALNENEAAEPEVNDLETEENDVD